MTERRLSETDGFLLDEENDDVSSTNSESENCNWTILTGTFIIQVVFSSVLASYGVLLVSLVEETGLTLREALWMPVTYTVLRCLADPLCKRISDDKRGQGSRLLAVLGVVMTVGGLATTTLLYSSWLRVLSYGLLGGVGTSLVLTQAEIILHCHYPRQRRSGDLPLCISQSGSALAHFSMPLLMLALVYVYGSRGATLLQAGLVFQGLIGAVFFIPPSQRPPTSPRHPSRPRAFTFVEGEGLPSARTDTNFNDRYTGRNSLDICTTSGRRWRNPTSTNGCLDSGERSVDLEIGSRCNKNGVDILPEIPEESEDNCDSDHSDISEDTCVTNSGSEFTDTVLYSGARSVDNYLGDVKVNVRSLDDSVGNKRWSIGTIEEVMPICVENGLAKFWPISEGNSSDNEDKDKKQFKNSSVSVELVKEVTRGKSGTFPLNGELWTTKSSGEVGSDFDKRNINEYDPLVNILKTHGARKTDRICRKVRSLDDVVSESDKMRLKNGRDAPMQYIAVSNMEDTCMHSPEDDNQYTTHVINIKPAQDAQKEWRSGIFDNMLPGDVKVTDKDDCRRFQSAEVVESNPSMHLSDFLHKISVDDIFASEVPKVHKITVGTGTDEICYEADETGSSLPGSSESEHPLWTAKLVSSESVSRDVSSQRCKVLYTLRGWSHRSSSLSQILRKSMFRCSCLTHHRHRFRRRYTWNRFISLFWYFCECVSAPYFFPSLLLRLTMRFCPMAFAALSPSLAKTVIDGCTNQEAAFSVSVSGLLWLCFLLLTPWCSKMMTPSKCKYLFATGSVGAAYGLHLLSRAESHDRLTLSCGIFGLGLGATMVTGTKMQREALGTWNLNRMDMILDLASGILILIAASLMGLTLNDNSGLPAYFSLLSAIYFVTGISWLLRPLLTRLRCQHHAHGMWSINEGHLLTTS